MPRNLKESRLRELEAEIAADIHGAVPLRFERACLLAEIGRTGDARDAYIDVLSQRTIASRGLNNLGTLLHRRDTGPRRAPPSPRPWRSTIRTTP